MSDQLPKTERSSPLKLDEPSVKFQMPRTRAAAPAPGMLQITDHIGRLAESMRCGELLFGFLDELVHDEEDRKSVV